MKIIVFGATGTVGLEVLQQASEAGHNVTAFLRDPAKIETLNKELIQSFIGNVLDPQQVAKAVPGHDAVIIVLGGGGKTLVRSVGTKNIIAAMKSAGLRRLICQTTLGAGDSKGNLNFFWKRIMFGLLLKKAYLDHEDQEIMVRESGLDWTIVRPAAFTNGALTGKYREGFPENAEGLTLKISRADVADFILKQLHTDKYLRKTPGLSY